MKFFDEKSLVSAYTPVHFLTGALASKYVGFGKWLLLHTAFELWENSKSGISFYQKQDRVVNKLLDDLGIDLDYPIYEGDSLKNSVADTVSTAVGWLVAKK